MKSLPSPNFNARPTNTIIDSIILHYTNMHTAQEALDMLRDPDAQVSAHYVVDEDGTLYQMVQEEHRAWHAGKSIWRGREGVNDFSIGIELINPGHRCGYRPFPQPQMEVLITLCHDIQSRHPIDDRNVIGHSDIAPSRKEDPGELFDWEMLASNNIGLWADVTIDDDTPLVQKEDEGETVRTVQTKLARYGYGIVTDGKYETHTEDTVKAFQRHFGQTTTIDGVWTIALDAKLDYLLQQVT